MTMTATPSSKSPHEAGGVYVDALLDVLLAAGRQPVLTYCDRDVRGVDLARSIARYARALHALGIGRGDLVALFAPNTPDALAIRYAAHVVGAAAMYLPDAGSRRQRAVMLAQLDPQLVVVFAETVQLVTETIAPIVGVRVDHPHAIVRLDDLAEVQASDPLRSCALPGDLAVVISSGGTTGTPKGSCRDFRTYGAMLEGPRRPQRRLLANGELAHLTQVLVDQTLLGGGSVVLADTCAPRATLEAIERNAVTDVFLVEPQLIDVVDHPALARHDLSSLQAVLHIGASAPTALRRRARERLGAVLVHTYGSSEAGIVSALVQDDYDPAHPNQFTSSGRLRAGVEVRFRRADGTFAGRCRAGTIEVRSPAVANGYRNLPVDDAATFAAGWCRTGDLGYLDLKGYLHVIGRADDVVPIGGALVAPTEVEDVLMRTTSVRVASVVVDRPGGRWVAAIAPWAGEPVDLDRCHEAVAEQLGDVVASHLELVVLDHLPLTGQGKPDRTWISGLHRGRTLLGGRRGPVHASGSHPRSEMS